MAKTEQKTAFNIRLNDPEAKENYAAIYGKGAAGVTRAGNAFLTLRGYTLRELKGRFTRAELQALIDNQNGTMFEPSYAVNKNMLIAHIEDGEEFEQICTKWKVSLERLREKITALTSAQCYFLVDEIDRFWNEPLAYGSPTPKLEAFLDDLCEK